METTTVLGPGLWEPEGAREPVGFAPVGPPVALPIGLEVAWLVGAPDGAGSVWWAVDEAGGAVGLRVDAEGGLRERRTTTLPAGRPPLLVPGPSGPEPLRVAQGEASAWAAPLRLEDETLWLDCAGALRFEGPAGTQRLALRGLPDARLARRGDALGLLTHGTDRFAHGSLGDGWEAQRMALLGRDEAGRWRQRGEVRAPQGRVIELLAPFPVGRASGASGWASGASERASGASERASGAGEPGWVLVFNGPAQRGATLELYDAAGGWLARSPEAGGDSWWRMPVGAGDFAGDGSWELASVRTPHIGGVLEFLRHEGDRLEIVAELPGVTAHRFGARNLALAQQVAMGGVPGILLPTSDRRALWWARRGGEGVQVGWQAELPAPLAGNPALAQHGAGHALAAAAGDQLMLWLPATAAAQGAEAAGSP